MKTLHDEIRDRIGGEDGQLAVVLWDELDMELPETSPWLEQRRVEASGRGDPYEESWWLRFEVNEPFGEDDLIAVFWDSRCIAAWNRNSRRWHKRVIVDPSKFNAPNENYERFLIRANEGETDEESF